MAEWLTPRTPDLDPDLDLDVDLDPGFKPRVVSLDKELYPTLSLFTQVFKWVP